MRFPILCLSLSACLALLSSASLPAQAPAAPSAPADTPAKYAAESIVIEQSNTVYSMNADGTGFREQSMVIKVQSEAAVRELGILNMGFAGASERVEIVYARVRRPDGTVLETPIADALEQPQPVTREAPFYSDLKQKQLPIKSLRAGDTLEWKIRVVRTKAEAPGQFWGQYSFVEEGISLNETLELRVPRSSTVNVWTNPKSSIKPVETAAGDQRIVRWQTAHLKPTTGPEADAEKKRREKELWTPEQELDAKEGKLPSIAWTTFKSWEEVGAWYRGLEGDRTIPDDALKAKVAELTAGKTSTEDKVKAVYAFVGPQVRYIGVAFGVGRYQPHHAEEVLENQYGDCKDKHTLLAAMLTALGLHPDAVLIGAGIRFNEAVPSPAAFNHLITRVDVDGKETWLDTTAEVAPYRMLTATIRDKRALVVPDSGPAHLERTPAQPPFASFQTMKVAGTLTKDGTETSHVTLTTRGDAELMLREILHQIPPAQYELFSQKIWGGMGFDGTTSHADLSRPEDTAQPVSLAFDDTREKAGGDWEHYRIVAQLIPASMPVVDEKEPPVQAIQLGAPQVMTSSFIMKLPEGWGAELPEAVHETAPFASYDLTFRFDKGTVYAERKIAVLQEQVPAADWSQYKKWMDKTQPNSFPYIQLTRTSRKADAGSKTEAGSKAEGGKDETGPPPPAVTNAEAAKLIQQAFEALRGMKADEGQTLLDQARKLNDQEKFLWAGYGTLCSLRGAANEARQDLRKELALHPDSYNVYPMLTYSFMQSNKRSEAMDTLREWAAADPSDPTPSIRLSAMQLQDGNAAAAYATMDTAIPRLPEEHRKDNAVLLALTNAEMKNGMQAKAAETLVEMLKTADDPEILNDAAYALSEAGRELPVAEAAQRKALEKMEAETASWTLDESPTLLKQKSALLAASWDTMGWILFREGKLEESRAYIEAAWRNRSEAVVGEHLGDIDMALQQPGPALTAYELAKAAGGPAPLLDEKQAKAKKAGGKVTSTDAHQELTSVRTIKLGPANGHYGAAEYKMLLTPTSVQRVEPAGDKTVPGGAEILGQMNSSQLFPPNSQARLAKSGILNCYAGQCVMIFEP